MKSKLKSFDLFVSEQIFRSSYYVIFLHLINLIQMQQRLLVLKKQTKNVTLEESQRAEINSTVYRFTQEKSSLGDR